MSRYEPKLGVLRVQRRDPIYDQEVRWDTGPNFGDRASVRVARVGNSVSITRGKGDGFSWTVEEAKLIHQALGNVIEAGEVEG